MRYIAAAVLLCSTFALATPTAQEAQRQSSAVRGGIVLHDIVILQGNVDKEIADAVSHGLFECSVVTSRCSEEAIHVVNERLRKLGYKCVTIISFTGDELDYISWEPK